MSLSFLKQLEFLPENMTAHDLVEMGMYPSIRAASAARECNAIAPPSTKIKNRYWYPRGRFISFVTAHYHACKRGKRPYRACQKTIKSLQSLSLFIREKDLVEHGVFNNSRHAYKCRASNCGPHYIRMGHKILYVRDEVIRLLQESNAE